MTDLTPDVSALRDDRFSRAAGFSSQPHERALPPDGNFSLLPGMSLACEHIRARNLELDRAG
jgi:hypothetical protein